MKTIDGAEKPMKKWTVSELKKYCHLYITQILKDGGDCCDSCPLYMNLCSRQFVYGWDLSEKKKFTEQEIEDAEVIRKILGNGFLQKSEDGLFWTSESSSVRLNPKLFPFLSTGEKIILSDIIGDANA